MPNFTCNGRDGQTRTFTYSISQGTLQHTAEWSIHVRRVDPPPTTDDFFELILREVTLGVDKIVQINNHAKPDFIGAGIPPVLLPLIARVRGVSIRSSGNRDGPDEFRTEAATKMWDRFVSDGQASYDEALDAYWLTL